MRRKLSSRRPLGGGEPLGKHRSFLLLHQKKDLTRKRKGFRARKKRMAGRGRKGYLVEGRGGRPSFFLGEPGKGNSLYQTDNRPSGGEKGPRTKKKVLPEIRESEKRVNRRGMRRDRPFSRKDHEGGTLSRGTL